MKKLAAILVLGLLPLSASAQTTHTSTTITQTVSAAAPVAATLSVSSSPNPSNFGQSVAVTGSVTGSNNGTTPSGTVSVSYQGTVLTTATISASGQFTCTVKSLPIGSDQLTITYSGDSNFY